MADLLAGERRRIAADVHDLIMQDLALALANARTLADDGVRDPLASTVVAAGSAPSRAHARSWGPWPPGTANPLSRQSRRARAWPPGTCP